MYNPVSPFFSVVIPVFNKEKYIKRAIDSVLNQSFDNFELIIVCDPSTDNSTQVVMGFSDERISILYRDEPGPGGYAARNLGINHAKAKWVAFLDADDFWFENHLQLSKAVLDRNFDVDLISFNSQQVDGENSRERMQLSQDHIISSDEMISRFVKDEVIHTNSIVALKSKLIEAGMFPAGKTLRGGDSDLWLRLLLVSDMCFLSEQVTSCYYLENSGVIKSYRTVGEVHPLTETVKRVIIEGNCGKLLIKKMKQLSNRKSISWSLIRKRSGFFIYKEIRNIFFTEISISQILKVLLLLAPAFIVKNLKPLD